MQQKRELTEFREIIKEKNMKAKTGKRLGIEKSKREKTRKASGG